MGSNNFNNSFDFGERKNKFEAISKIIFLPQRRKVSKNSQKFVIS